MHWIGLDIGGANIKLADERGTAIQHAFPLWQQPALLAAELEGLLEGLDSSAGLAVTMTGELADCFPDKLAGVEHIVRAAEQAAGQRLLQFYSVAGNWHTTADCCDDSSLASSLAASNWHGLARFASRFQPADSQLLIDVGSTTVDIIPIAEGSPAARGQTDTERLAAGELVYCGVRRTPLATLVDELPWQGGSIPIARERFATTHDVYLLTGEISEEISDLDTADGCSATIGAAADRLARMVCACPSEVARSAALDMARAVAARQRSLVASALRQVLASMSQAPQSVIVAGEGSFLAQQALEDIGCQATVLCLKEQLGPDLAAVATALAMATLASEEVLTCQ